MWEEITYPFLNFNATTVEVNLGMDKYFIPHFTWAFNYLSMVGLNIIHVSKSGHRSRFNWLGFTLISPSAAFIRKWTGSALFKVMAWRQLEPSHYLNQCRLIIWTPRDILQWNSNQNTKVSTHKNAFENIVCGMVAFMSRGKLVNVVGYFVSVSMCLKYMGITIALVIIWSIWRKNIWCINVQVKKCITLWRHQMETFPALLALIFLWSAPE